MGQFEDYKLFLTIVDQGSVGRAAEELNIAKSAVSRRLKLLEERYDATLIDRAPGEWSLTAFGHEFYDRVKPKVEGLVEVHEDFISVSQSLQGRLRVSCAYHFGMNFLLPALLAFKAKYPDIDLTLDFDDRVVNLEKENYDLAIRIQEEPPQDNVIIKLGTSEMVMCASSDYLKKNGRPSHPNDLKNHQILNYGLQKRTNWQLSPITGKSVTLELRTHLNSNDGVALLTAAKQDMGIVRIPDFLCRKSFDDDELERLLPEWSSPQLGIYLVSPLAQHFNKKMRVFAEEISEVCLKTLA